jgi:hypothetical protein
LSAGGIAPTEQLLSVICASLCGVWFDAGGETWQFGLNEDLFADNSGSFEISIADLPQPTPPGQIFNGP